MATDGEVIRFCDGCPAQRLFVGDLTPDSMDTSVDQPKVLSSDVTTTLRFIDPDGQKSLDIYTRITTEEIQQSGISVNVRANGYTIRNPKTIRNELERAATATGEDIVRRVARCATVSYADGFPNSHRRCPAMEVSVFRALFLKNLKKPEIQS